MPPNKKRNVNLEVVQYERRRVSYRTIFQVNICALAVAVEYSLSEPPKPRTVWYNVESSRSILVVLPLPLSDMN